VWEEEPHAAIEGPTGASIADIFSEKGATAAGNFILEGRLSEDLHDFVKASLTMLQYNTTDDDQHTRSELASYTLLASVLLSMKDFV